MKSEIQVNYSVIASIRDNIQKYKTALETMEQKLNEINSELENENSGQAVDALVNMHDDLQSDIDSCKIELESLYDLFSGYYEEMTNIIKPTDEFSAVLVDRTDIWWNMESIFESLTAIEAVSVSGMYDSNGNFVFNPGSNLTDEETEARQWNYQRMQDVWDVINSYKSAFEEDKDYMTDLFNNKIVPYEDKDDEYASKANQVYESNVNQYERQALSMKHMEKSIEGLYNSSVALLQGLFNFAVDGGRYALGFVGWVMYQLNFDDEDIDVSFSDHEQDFYAGNKEIYSIYKNPTALAENVVQDASDAFDRKGIYYVGGYAVPYVVGGLKSSASKEVTVGEEEVVINKNVLDPSIFGNKKILGQNGAQFESKTTWQNGKTERIDVENPSPGERPGQIHYHEPDNTKWYFDIEDKEFYDQKTGQLAPKKIQNLLKDKNVINAINKGLKFLGEDKLK